MWGPGPVVTLCLFEVKVQVQNDSSYLWVALSELVIGRENLLPAEENSPLNFLSSLVKKKYRIKRGLPENQDQAMASDCDATPESKEPFRHHVLCYDCAV